VIAWLPPTQRPEPDTRILVRGGVGIIMPTLHLARVTSDGEVEDDRGEYHDWAHVAGWIPAADLLALPIVPCASPDALRR
jgi:hypothetical protein